MIMSYATSRMITLIFLARVTLVSSEDSLFLIWGMFRKINVFIRPLFLILSTSDFSLLRLVERLVIWLLISYIYKSWLDIFFELSVINSVLEWTSSNAALADFLFPELSSGVLGVDSSYVFQQRWSCFLWLQIFLRLVVFISRRWPELCWWMLLMPLVMEMKCDLFCSL